ncbi:right-handed parallel beta-helix repeat-containing protein [Chryseobacterium tongliaoense]|uniref:right-handed parallel beta-helix repeat-containing protein n=1 Tax=Chryseobacterium tongliaoense TaxID=3240933 RepID=UPI0035184F96
MEKIQIIDPNTLEVANYIKTNVWHDGTPMTLEKCDDVLYKEIECGVFYQREIAGTVRMAWYKHLMTTIDVSEVINSAIDCASPNSVIDGEGGFYDVHSIWLKSDITFKNFNLKSIGTSESDVSVLCIGNDFYYQNNPNPFLSDRYAERAYKRSTTVGESNIKIENVTIDGNRKDHTGLGPDKRDGGKQGICIKGKVSEIKIKNCKVTYCATDGLQIYSSLLRVEDDMVFAATDIEIDGLICDFNRRHGASGDSIERLIVRNSRFNSNGQTIDNSTEGNQGALFNGVLYGNGWDMEGYGVGSNIHDIQFINCRFVKNIKYGLLIYDAATGTEANFKKRSKIFIKNCEFDSGIENPEFTALAITGNQINLSHGVYLYDDIVVDNCNILGRLLLKSIKNIIIRNCHQIYDELDPIIVRGVLQNVESAIIRNTQTQRYLWEGIDFKILSDDILTSSMEVDFGQINAGALQTIDVTFPEAEFGDIVTTTLTTLNEARFKEFTLTGLIPYPANKVLVTIKNNSNHTEIVSPGKLKIFVEKKLIEK